MEMHKMFTVLAMLGVVALAPVSQAAPAAATAASATITRVGVVPSQVKVSIGDSVTWLNTDTVDHQLLSNKAGLASPVLRTGQSFTFTFSKGGNFTLTDALNKKLDAGAVFVAGSPAGGAAGASVSLTSSTFQVVYNGPVTLSGTVSSHEAGQKVAIQAQRFGENSFSKLADVTTLTGGTWSYTARPTIRTVFQSTWGKLSSPQVTVGVRPLVTFHLLTGNRFSTKVVAGRSFAGKVVQLQRRSGLGQWVTLKRPTLNASSVAIFRAGLPNGSSTLRIAFSVNQAGAGYLGGTSRTATFHRG
jgi:plastocyanin